MQVSNPTAPPLLFLHLPKTAGGSIRQLIESAYQAPDLYLFYLNEGTSYEQAAVEAKGARLVYGHFAHGFHEHLGCDPLYTCFLRNPVERTISHYHYVIAAAKDSGREGEIAQNAGSIGKYIEQTRLYTNENMMCRIISGLVGDMSISDDALFGRAMRHMEQQFPVFGITELMPLSLEVMRRSIGLPVDSLPPQVNKGNYRLKELTDHDIEQVVRANQADLRLYRWAVDRFLSVVVPNALKNPPLVSPGETRDDQSPRELNHSGEASASVGKETSGVVPVARCA
jgi:hypothetical protein